VAEIIYRGDCVKLHIDLLENAWGGRSGRRPDHRRYAQDPG
jgi:hypothetical protein